MTGAARPWRLWVTAGALALTTLSVTWTLQTRAAAVAELRFEASATGVTAIDASERTRWRYRFPVGDRVTLLGTDVPLRVTLRGTPAVFVASAHSIGRVDEIAKAGVLTWLGTDGARHGSFAFDDDVVMEGKRYGSPWALTSFAIDETNGGRRVAVAGHHWTWDPGLVTVLDENWVRRGTFVHAGWIEGVRWLSRDRLVAAGFSNPQDGGMIALLDPSALDAALRMAVMPRSEVNRVTMSRFNRARVELIGDRIVVKTIEADTPANGDGAVDAVYEFSRDLELVSANFGDQYWAMHRALEEQGRLDHTREQCPDRDGPREVEMWEPATGWRMISLRPSG